MNMAGEECLLGRLRRHQARAPIAAAASRLGGEPESLATRLRPRDGAFNSGAAILLTKWKDP